jgi:SiaC family regulatory phosphoprotein
MSKLILKETSTTPKVTFDPEKQFFEVRGNSIVLNALEFYSPLSDWIKQNHALVDNGANFMFCLPFFNSASSKGIVMVLKEIRQLQQAKNDVKILWCIEEDDEFMKEAGENFSEFLEMNFEMVNV